jgi:hypothetical protein
VVFIPSGRPGILLLLRCEEYLEVIVSFIFCCNYHRSVWIEFAFHCLIQSRNDMNSGYFVSWNPKQGDSVAIPKQLSWHWWCHPLSHHPRISALVVVTGWARLYHLYETAAHIVLEDSMSWRSSFVSDDKYGSVSPWVQDVRVQQIQVPTSVIQNS